MSGWIPYREVRNVDGPTMWTCEPCGEEWLNSTDPPSCVRCRRLAVPLVSDVIPDQLFD